MQSNCLAGHTDRAKLCLLDGLKERQSVNVGRQMVDRDGFDSYQAGAGLVHSQGS